MPVQAACRLGPGFDDGSFADAIVADPVFRHGDFDLDGAVARKSRDGLAGADDLPGLGAIVVMIPAWSARNVVYAA